MLAWLNSLPTGTNNDYFKGLEKSSQGYSCQVDIGGEVYDFTNISENYLAAIALVQEGETGQDILTKGASLAKLAKTIDLLIKSNVPKPLPPPIPQKIDPTEEITQNIKPPTGNTQRKIKLYPQDLEKACPQCGTKLFKNEQFQGCICLTEVKKKLYVEKNIFGVFLKGNLSDQTFHSLLRVIK